MAIATAPSPAPAEDQVFRLWNVAWWQYVAINDAIGERPKVRMIYRDGNLTLVGPARRHVFYADRLDAIITALAVGCGIEWNIAGAATFRSEGLGVGVEADNTYYFREHAHRLVGAEEIDLTTQPPPDLAAEVVYPHSSEDSMIAYDRLGVPEVWRYRVNEDILTFYHLRPGGGGYDPAPASRNLAMLTPEDVLGQLRLAAQPTPMSRWYVGLNAWVRDAIRPRMVGGR